MQVSTSSAQIAAQSQQTTAPRRVSLADLADLAPKAASLARPAAPGPVSQAQTIAPRVDASPDGRYARPGSHIDIRV
jgi:hypothetical protein